MTRDCGTRTRAAVVTLCIVVGIGLAGCTKVVSAPSNQTLNTVTASGSGTVSAIPDIAVMSFGATAQSANAKTALDQVSAKATKIASAVKQAGVADKDIQTQNVSVYPQTNSVNGKDTVTGYQASLSVSAKVRDLGSLSKVIEAASNAGADTIGGPTFSISDDSSYRGAAVQKAVDDSRRSAAAMAKAAGKQVGTVLSITSQNSAGPIVPLSLDAGARSTGTSVPVQTGQLDVTSNVTVVFELR